MVSIGVTSTEDGIVYRLSGAESAPVALYLPGVHGDFTPMHRASPLLSAQLRLLELSYPRGEFDLKEFVSKVKVLLSHLNIERAHLIAESFGSLVGWELARSYPALVQSLILVGGFVGPLPHKRALFAHHGLSLIPPKVFELSVDLYVAGRNLRSLGRPSPAPELKPYFSLRGREGWRSTVGRLRAIAESDNRPSLSHVSFPVRYVGGARDLIVPGKGQLRYLSELLPPSASFQAHVIPAAPHMILVSHPTKTVSEIVRWILEIEKGDVRSA